MRFVAPFATPHITGNSPRCAFPVLAVEVLMQHLLSLTNTSLLPSIGWKKPWAVLLRSVLRKPNKNLPRLLPLPLRSKLVTTRPKADWACLRVSPMLVCLLSLGRKGQLVPSLPALDCHTWLPSLHFTPKVHLYSNIRSRVVSSAASHMRWLFYACARLDLVFVKMSWAKECYTAVRLILLYSRRKHLISSQNLCTDTIRKNNSNGTSEGDGGWPPYGFIWFICQVRFAAHMPLGRLQETFCKLSWVNRLQKSRPALF